MKTMQNLMSKKEYHVAIALAVSKAHAADD
jgi:hypothetical protein